MAARAQIGLAGLVLLVGFSVGCGSEASPTNADAGAGDGGSETSSGDAGDTLPTYEGSKAPKTPAEAFDLAAIKAATLGGLKWVETETTSVDGVRVLDGTWSPGAFTGLENKTGALTTIGLASRARIFYPDAATGPLPIVVHAAHVASAVPADDAQYRQIAKGLGVAVVVHGELPDDGHALGYPDAETPRDLLIDKGMAYVVQKNACKIVDLLTANFAFVLARTSMLAVTLGQRLLEAAGKSAGPAALQGGSKEGYATWVASAVDDRLAVAGPGNFQRLDFESFDAYEHNDGCGPNGASSAVDVLAQLTIRNWFRDTEAGKAAAKVLQVASFVDQLRPSFFSMCGDAGMPGKHDGSYFTLGADTHFLDGFTRPHRFERGPDNGRLTDVGRLAFLAQALVSVDPAATLGSWVRVSDAQATDGGTSVSFRTTLASTAGVTHVYAYWNNSPNRQFNDAGQSPWQQVELFATGASTTYSSAPVTPPAGEEVAWFVAAQQIVDIGKGVMVSRFDTSPIRLMRELPKLSCASVPPIGCAP